MSQNNAETVQISRPDALEARLSAYDPRNTVETPPEEAEIVQNSVDASNVLLSADTATTPDPKASCAIHDHYPKKATRSNKSAVLASADSVDDFKRARTKFTSEQIQALEVFFAQNGPHPSRAQRLAMAEELQMSVILLSLSDT